MAEPIVLPPLPFVDSALAPIISAQTLGFHYGKHHKAYVDNLNKLLEGHELAGQALETIIRECAGKADRIGMFNNAAQIWNHSFYWDCLSPKGGGQPGGAMGQRIEQTFGSYESFKKEFAQAALTQFGSGWAWLVAEAGALKIVKTPNAEVPFTKGQKPLLTIDVWEHAYYLDYQNRRGDYVNAVIDKLLNWRFAEENFERA